MDLEGWSIFYVLVCSTSFGRGFYIGGFGISRLFFRNLLKVVSFEMWQNFPKYLRFTSSVEVISSVQVIPGPVSKEEQLLWERKK